MKKVFIYLTVILLFGICQVTLPSEDPAKLKGSGDNPVSEIMLGERIGADKQGTVKASAVIPSAEEKQILKDLNEARTAGDHESARTLQAYLDRLHGVTTNTSSTAIQAPPVVHSGEVDSEPPATPEWSGDVLITDPTIPMIRPSIVSTPGGVLYAAVEVQSDNNIRIYRSFDGGMSWSYIYWIGAGDDLRNPCVAYGQDGAGNNALYVAMEVYSGGVHGVLVMHLDVDALVQYNTYVEWGFSLPGSEQVYPRICTDYLFFTGYYVYVTYSVHAIDYYPVMFSRSLDFGVTFSAPANITGGAENSQWQTRPDVAYGLSGLFVAYEKLGWNGSNWETQPWVLESNNDGASFISNTQLAASTSPGFHPAVAAAPDDNCIVVAYTKDFGSDTDCYYAYSTNGGTSWNTEYALPWTYDNEKSPDLCTSFSNGQFHAAYFQDTYSVRYTNADCSSPSSWDSGTIVNDVEFASNAYPRPSVCVNPTLPLAEEGCVSWTDFRGTYYGAFFDTAVIPPLSSDTSVVSASAGGTVNFFLKAGASNGGRNYILLGSLTGVSPGTLLPGGYAVLPINWDAFTDLVLNMINTPVFFNFLGTLNASGEAQAQLNSPPISGIYVGFVMDYAFCLNNLFDYVSNPRGIEIVP